MIRFINTIYNYYRSSFEVLKFEVEYHESTGIYRLEVRDSTLKSGRSGRKVTAKVKVLVYIYIHTSIFVFFIKRERERRERISHFD
jgi:hypothetical protein